VYEVIFNQFYRKNSDSCNRKNHKYYWVGIYKVKNTPNLD